MRIKKNFKYRVTPSRSCIGRLAILRGTVFIDDELFFCSHARYDYLGPVENHKLAVVCIKRDNEKCPVNYSGYIKKCCNLKERK